MAKTSSKGSSHSPVEGRKKPASDRATKSGRMRLPINPKPEEHEGGTESEVGDRTGPGAGYDEEPPQEKDKGGVS